SVSSFRLLHNRYTNEQYNLFHSILHLKQRHQQICPKINCHRQTTSNIIIIALNYQPSLSKCSNYSTQMVLYSQKIVSLQSNLASTSQELAAFVVKIISSLPKMVQPF